MDSQDAVSPSNHPLLEPTPMFTASWSPSKASSLDTASLPITKVPRAWERAPKSPQAEHSKVKKVWKRYGLRSQPQPEQESAQQDLVEVDDGEDAQGVGERSPLRIVKRLRVRSPRKAGAITLEEMEEANEERYYTSTRWDRRSSGLGHKTTFAFPPEEIVAREDQLEPTKRDNTELEEEILEDIETLHDQEKIVISEGAEPSGQLVPCPEDVEAAIRPKDPLQVVPQVTSEQQTECSPKASLPAGSPQEIMRSPSIEERIQFDLASEHASDEAADSTSKPDAETPIKSGSATTMETHTDVITTPVNYPMLLRSEDSISSAENKENVAELYQDTLSLLALSPSKRMINTPVDESMGNFEQRETSLDDVETISYSENLPLGSPTLILSFHKSPQSQKHKTSVRLSPSNDVSYPNLSNTSPLRDPESALVQAERDATAEDEESNNSADELSPEAETQTFTLNIDSTTTLLEDDKAILRSFLNRAAASKASKSTNSAYMTRRESLQNRRDSDAVRHALASPRHVLEEKDTNLSPRGRQNVTEPVTPSLNGMIYSQSPLAKRSAQEAGLGNYLSPSTIANDEGEDELTLTMDLGSQTNGSPRRRSSRTRSSKIPSTPSATAQLMGPPKIPVRTDGGERVLLNRTEAQQLADLVRKNTKKNKGGAVSAPQRLIALKTDALLEITSGFSSPLDTTEPTAGEVKSRNTAKIIKSLRWREELVEFSTTPATVDLEESVDEKPAKPQTTDEEPKKAATPRLRRLKGLGAANGTPARQLLGSTLLPDDVDEDRTAAQAKGSHRAAAPAPEAVVPKKEAPPRKEKKSKIQPPSTSIATNKKLLLNPSLTSLSGLPVLAGKENTSQLLSPAKKLPGRGKIPVPASSLGAVAATPIKRAARGSKKA